MEQERWGLNASPDEFTPGDAADGFLVFGQGEIMLGRKSAMDNLVGPAVALLGPAWRETWDLAAAYCAVRVPALEQFDESVPYDREAMRAAITEARRAWPPADMFEHFADPWGALPIRIAALGRHALRVGDLIANPTTSDERASDTGEALYPGAVAIAEAVFGGVTNAHSAVEVFAYALTSLLALRMPRLVRLDRPEDIRRVSMASTRQLLESPNGLPRAAVTRRLRLFLESPEFRELMTARNVLVHRGMPIGGLYGTGEGGMVYIAHAQLHARSQWVLRPESLLGIAEAVRSVLGHLVADTVEVAEGLRRPVP